MDKSQLLDGRSYIITRDVTNPKPDRRMTRQLDAAKTWVRGTRLLCRARVGYVRLECEDLYGSVGEHDPGFDLLVAALEPAPRSFATVLYEAKHGPWAVSSREILSTLMDQGKISLQDVEQAIAAHEASQGE